MPYKEGKKWRGVVTVAGKRYTKLCPTKGEATEWERKERRELLTPKKIGMDLFTFFQVYLDHAKSAFINKTYSEKNNICKRLILLWGSSTDVEAITPKMCLDYLNSRKCSNDRFNKERKNLLAMWSWGQQILDLKSNPVAKIRQLPHNRGVQYVPPMVDIMKILAVATPEERVFLYSYLHTGARRSSIFRWTWGEDIDLKSKQVRVGSRKSRDGSMKYKWLPMTNELYDNLKWWWGKRADDQYVFVSKRKGPWTERRGFLKDLCERAKVRGFGFHAIRRHVASVLAAQGVSLKVIGEILDHSRLSTTEQYIYNMKNDLTATMELLENKSSIHKTIHTNKKGLTLNQS